MYDLVTEAGGLSDEQERKTWQSFAKRQVHEVTKRVKDNETAVSV